MRTRYLTALTALSMMGCAETNPRCPTSTMLVDGICQEIDGEDGGRDSAIPTDDTDGSEPARRDAEDDAPTECFLDEDGDGVGGGEPIDCDTLELIAARQDSSVPSFANTGGDCDDADGTRSPSSSEICDKIDNDCDGVVDNGATNGCGGECSVSLPHQPGDACENSLLGACVRTGKYVCAGLNDVTCNADSAAPSSEICGDSIDNDCDGVVDEPDAVNATTWYLDCDGDGYAADVAGSIKACVRPANLGACTWTSVFPQPRTATNWDCDDSSAAYTPAAGYGDPPSGSTNFDLNCDLQVTRDPSVQRSQFPTCGQNVLDWINRGGRAAWRADNTSNTANCPIAQSPGSTITSADDFCTAWRNDGGLLVRDPPQYCPDIAVTLSWNSKVIDTAGGYTRCSVNRQLGSLWKCR